MRKFKEFLDKPMTWGGYLKFCFWCTIGSVIYSIVYFAYLFGYLAKLGEKISGFFSKFSGKAEPVEDQ